MTRTTTRLAIMALCAALFHLSSTARATTMTTPVNLPNGTFGAMLSGSGDATITGASGLYKQHVGDFFGHIYADFNVTAANQTVGISMPNVNIANTVASGTANIDYDDVAPGTPVALNSLSADFNGAGGSNEVYPFAISVDPLTINISGLLDADLYLTVNGMITDATFTSSGSAAASPYLIPGTLNLTLQATVTGSLDLGALGTVGLGTIFSLAPTTIPINTPLPGIMLLTDLSGGLGPYPADMGVDLNAAIPLPITAPLDLPFSLNETYSLSGHNSGFTSLVINPGSMLNLDLTLGNPSYDLNGVVPMALVPEPSSVALSSLALVGLIGMIWRRKRAA